MIQEVDLKFKAGIIPADAGQTENLPDFQDMVDARQTLSMAENNEFLKNGIMTTMKFELKHEFPLTFLFFIKFFPAFT